MPIFGEETQVKRQDKRGILGLSHGGFGGSVLQGDSLAIGAGNLYSKLFYFHSKLINSRDDITSV